MFDEALATDEIRTALADSRLCLTPDDMRAHLIRQMDRIVEVELAEIARRVGQTAVPDRSLSRWLPWVRSRASTVDQHRDAERDAADAALRARIREDGVLPVLRELINERMRPYLWATMRVGEAPGLDRVRDRRYVVETESAQRFLELARQIRYGAIGIAGVRGAGKSTVIEYYQAKSPAQVKVLVPAPVQYNAREFVLHLYAELCNTVISRYGYELQVQLDDNRARLRRLVRYGIPAVVLCGLGALVVGPSRLLTVSAWSTAQLWAGGALLILGAAALLRVLTTLLAASDLWLLWLWESLVGIKPPIKQERELVAQARARLRRIRFLQTTTTGWSGKVTVPSGEVGLTRSAALAQQALTYPEVVHDLRQFIGLAVARLDERPAVIVAVDELDKIEDPEQAQAFVNEIKGVFGVHGAQFLVSVSEDALASFERRGLPVRDAFDSAFDEIVRIEPLDLDDACRLLRSRVIGLPDLFGALAHCVAGGLARDIIRTARSMRAVATADGAIEPVCRLLLEADVRRKIHAFTQATGGLDGTPDTTSFIRALRTLRADPATILDALPALLPEPDDKADFRQVRFQAATYAYHCATVLAVFTADLTTDRFESRRTTLDRLAAAKLELGTRPQSAWLMLDEFRTAWGLPTVPVASTRVAGTGTPGDPPSR